MRLFRALRHRPFRLLWAGQTLSRVGDSLYKVAVAWWVFEQTGSASGVGRLFFFSSAPLLLFLVVGGVAVDRLPRRSMMLASDALRCGVMAALALTAQAGALELWHAYAAAATLGFFNAFFQPAYVAFVPEVAPSETLPSANSLTALSNQAADVIGPALGALVITAGGVRAAFALNGLSFLVAAGCLLPLLRLPTQRRAAPGRRDLIGDARAGLSAIFSSTWLWLSIVIASVGNVTMAAPFFVAMPLLMKEHFGADAGGLGVAYSMFAVGSTLAAAWLGRMTAIPRRGLLAYAAWVVSGAAIFACGLRVPLAAVWAASFVFGVAMTVFSLIWTSTLQELVPRELLGRVYSLDQFGSIALLPLGYGLTGWATDRVGVGLIFALGGVFTMGLGAFGLSRRAIRHLN